MLIRGGILRVYHFLRDLFAKSGTDGSISPLEQRPALAVFFEHKPVRAAHDSLSVSEKSYRLRSFYLFQPGAEKSGRDRDERKNLEILI